MNFRLLTSDKYTCPALSSQAALWSVPGGTLVSVGFQNIGNATSFWTSQMFIEEGPAGLTDAYIQVVNTSLSGTDWYIKVMQAYEGDAAPPEPGEVKILEETEVEKTS